MRVGLNAMLMSDAPGYRQSGIDRYLRELIGALPGALGNDELVVFSESGLDAARSAGVTLEGAPRITRWPAARITWERFILPSFASRRGIELFHGGAFAVSPRLRIPTVVTIHDLAFLMWPEQVPKRRFRYLNRSVRESAKRATRLIAVSEATRADVIRLLDVDSDRVLVTPLGVDPAIHRASLEDVSAFRQTKQLNRPFVLAVGTREPRKNLPALIEAFASIAGDVPHDLIHIGSDGWLMDGIFESVRKAKLGGRLRMIDFVAYGELPLWYSAAACFVMPSLYEGFGLPLLEALACGVPAIASNTSSLPEVAGDAALICETDAESIATALFRLLTEPELARRLVELGPQQAQRFTWQRTAELTAQVYREAFDG